MTSEIWLIIVSGLVTLIGTLVTVMYRDISSRLAKLEKQDAKIFQALVTLLTVKGDDTQAIANAMYVLISNGVQRTPV